MEDLYVELINKAKELIKNVSIKRDPFNKKTIVFQNRSCIEWFKSFWIKTEDKVLCNIDLITLDEYFDSNDCNYKKLNDKDSMYWDVLKELCNISDPTDVLYDYLHDSTNLNMKRLSDLTDTLVELFIKYNQDMSYETPKISSDDINTKLYEKEIYIYNQLFNSYNLSEKYKKLNIDNDISDLSNKILFSNSDNLYFFNINYLTNYQKCLLLNNKIVFNDSIDITLKDFYKTNLSNLDSYVVDSVDLELVNVHANICNKIKDCKDLEKNAFLVIAPDISKYESKIERIFNQNDFDFPRIDYIINGNKDSSIDAINGMKIINKIISNEYMNRSDFIDIISNPYFQRVRHINQDEKEFFEQILLLDHVYRKDDFLHIKNRLLASKYIEHASDYTNVVKLGSDDKDKFIPFFAIGLSDDMILKFINIIDDVNELLDFKYETLLCDDNIDKFRMCLDKWFKVENTKYIDDIYYMYKDYLYQLKNNIYCSSLSLTFEYLITGLLKITKPQVDNSYNHTVVFNSFNHMNVLPYKYVYFIGMSSNSFPSISEKNELDFSIDSIKINELELNTFNKQLQAVEKVALISYLSKDLVKDAPYYPTQCIEHLFKNVKKDDKRKICLSDLQVINNIYTKKELMKILISNNYMEKKTIEVKENKYIPSSFITVNYYTATQLRDLIIEPFEAKMKKLIHKNELDYESLGNNYGDISLNHLDKYNFTVAYTKALIQDKLEGKSIYASECENSIRNRIKYTNILRDDFIITSELDNIKKKAMEHFALIEKNLSSNDYYLLPYNEEIKIGDFVVRMNSEVVYQCIGDSLAMIPLHFSSVSFKDKINLLLNSLLFVIRKNMKFHVKLYYCKTKAFDFVISPDDASKIITGLIIFAKDYNNVMYVKFESIMKYIKNVDDLKDNIIYDVAASIANDSDYDDILKYFDVFSKMGFDIDTIKDKYLNHLNSFKDIATLIQEK